MGIALYKNANERIKETIAQREVIDYYKAVKREYNEFSSIRRNAKSKKEVRPSTTFISNIQILLTKIALAVSEVAVSVKCRGAKKGDKGTNYGIAIAYLCKGVLHDNQLYNDFKDADINRQGNAAKHTKGKVWFNIDTCVAKYNVLINRLVKQLKLFALNDIRITLNPSKSKKSHKSQNGVKTVYDKHPGFGIPPGSFSSWPTENRSEVRPQTSNKDGKRRWVKWTAIGMGIAIAVVSAILLAVYSKQIEWWEWQWIIGSLVGFAIFTGAVLLLRKLSKSNVIKKPHLYGWIRFAVVYVLNFIFFGVWPLQYKFVCICMLVYLFIGGLGLTVSQKEFKSETGLVFRFVATGTCLLMLILVMPLLILQGII